MVTKEKQREYNKKADLKRRNNPERIKFKKENGKIYRSTQKYKEKYRNYQTIYLSDPIKREKHRKILRDSNEKLAIKAIDFYSNGKRICAKCGNNNPKFLTIDHINNDGNVHRKQIKRIPIYAWLYRNNYPKEGFQVLCYNCNSTKHIRSGWEKYIIENNDWESEL